MKTLLLTASLCALCALCGCQTTGDSGQDGRVAPLPIEYYAQ